MEWKIGDRIKFIKEGIIDSIEFNNLTLNKIYTIIQIRKDIEDNRCNKLNGMNYKINRDGGAEWWIEYNSFQLIKDHLTEIDVLNSIQANFKEGY